jgi:hypothetical protein
MGPRALAGGALRDLPGGILRDAIRYR